MPTRDKRGESTLTRTRGPRSTSALVEVALIALIASVGACDRRGGITCETEVTSGGGSFLGTSKGPTETRALRVASVREACRQMCASNKEPILDVCASRCAADVEAGKVGAKTSCSSW